MHDRVKELRRALGLTQSEFADKIGITGTAVSLYESGKRGVSETLVKSICREFGVSYLWLTTGEGEMFEPKSEEQEIYELVDRILSGENAHVRAIFRGLSKLDAEDWSALEAMIDKILDGARPWEE